MDEHKIPQAWLPTLTPRWREVEEYAAKRHITLGEAVAELINKGLSYAATED